jgi:hypothetical protein
MKSWWPVVIVGVAGLAFVGFLVLAGLAAAGLVGKGSAPTCDASTGSGGGGGKLYMIGDSITVGIDSDQGKIKPRLTAKGYEPTVEAVGGKMLTWGIDVVKNKKEQLKDTKTFVVELGTNYYTGEDTRFDNEVEDMVSAIKAANNDAEIYWVNIISDIPYRSKFNQVLESKSGSLKFTVIDLYKDRDKIAMEPDKIHPSWDGSDTYAKLVVEGLGGSGGGGGECPQTDAPGETFEFLVTNYTPGTSGDPNIEGGLECTLSCNMKIDSSSPTGYTVTYKGKKYTGEFASTPASGGGPVGPISGSGYDASKKLIVIPCYNNDEGAIGLDHFGVNTKKAAVDLLITNDKMQKVIECWKSRKIEYSESNNGFSSAYKVKGKVISGS